MTKAYTLLPDKIGLGFSWTNPNLVILSAEHSCTQLSYTHYSFQLPS